jgi:hypothetical protein
VAGAFSPHTGSYYLYSDRSDLSYKRLMRTVDLTGVNAAELSFFASWDTELDWDDLFVEAHTVGQDDWTTLPAVDPDGEPITAPGTGESCPAGWRISSTTSRCLPKPAPSRSRPASARGPSPGP